MEDNKTVICPHCSKPAFSKLQKFFLGPGRKLECPHCKKKCSVSYIIMALIGVLLIIGKFKFNTIRYFNISESTWLILFFLIAIGMLVYIAKLPLEKR
jgi:hypothetical protein